MRFKTKRSRPERSQSGRKAGKSHASYNNEWPQQRSLQENKKTILLA